MLSISQVKYRKTALSRNARYLSLLPLSQLQLDASIWFTEYQKSEVCKAAQGTARMKPDDMQTHDRAYVLVVRLTAQEMRY